MLWARLYFLFDIEAGPSFLNDSALKEGGMKLSA